LEIPQNKKQKVNPYFHGAKIQREKDELKGQQWREIYEKRKMKAGNILGKKEGMKKYRKS
jgi:hypothetical protein